MVNIVTELPYFEPGISIPDRIKTIHDSLNIGQSVIASVRSTSGSGIVIGNRYSSDNAVYFYLLTNGNLGAYSMFVVGGVVTQKGITLA